MTAKYMKQIISKDPRTARVSADYWYEEAWKNAGKCVFCDLKDKYIIAEKDNVVLAVNLYQYIDGHLMVIPRRHIESLEETNQTEWQAIFYLLNLGVKKLREKLKINDVYILDRPMSGFKTGKTVAHSHFHIIPYKPELVSWHFQEVVIHPEELAKKLR